MSALKKQKKQSYNPILTVIYNALDNKQLDLSALETTLQNLDVAGWDHKYTYQTTAKDGGPLIGEIYTKDGIMAYFEPMDRNQLDGSYKLTSFMKMGESKVHNIHTNIIDD